jgi:Zn-dependent protease with chaperone function/type II secretory pathway pseudopilin PulG
MNISQTISELLAAGKTDEEIISELQRKGLSAGSAGKFLERAKTGTTATTTAPAPSVGAPRLAATAGAFDPQLRHPNEQPLFIVGVIFSTLVWLLLAVSIVGIFYGVIGAAFALMAHALFLANVKGNGVRVSERQFPDLDARCRRAAQSLGLAEAPDVYLMQAGGALNAFATKLLSRKFMIIYSDLADECEDPRQLDFVIGHEMGHLAAGHLKWNAFLWPFMLLPWLGAAYMRAREYTSDRCGFAFVGDVEPSMRGLVVLAAGGKHATRADLNAFMEQRLETGRFFPAVLELVSTHPFLCKRVAALQELHQPGTVAPVSRNPLAYPLAPVFGLMAAGPAGGLGGMLVMVAVVGMIAAIAIPSLLRARVSANESATLGDIRTVISAQATYASENHGYYESDPSCLGDPSKCMPGYKGPPLLEAPIATGTKSGYVRQMYAGRAFAAGSARPAGVSPTSTDGFAIVARPAVAGRTGVRAFCGDASGVICAGAGSTGSELVERLGEEPWIRCSSSCMPLQ